MFATTALAIWRLKTKIPEALALRMTHASDFLEELQYCSATNDSNYITGQWACTITPHYSLELKLSFKP
jgi:hypothetical protein